MLSMAFFYKVTCTKLIGYGEFVRYDCKAVCISIDVNLDWLAKESPSKDSYQ